MDKSTKSVALVLAAGLVLCGLLWVLGLVAHPIAEAIGIVVKSFGAAVGLAFKTATTGFGTAGTISTLVAPMASIGLAGTGLGTSYFVIVKIVKKGKEAPYDWLLPALGIVAIFFVDLTKDVLVENGLERAGYAFCTGLLTIGGGALLRQPKRIVRTIGFILPFVPAAIVWFLFREKQAAVKDSFHASGNIGIITISGVLFIACVTSILGVILPKKD